MILLSLFWNISIFSSVSRDSFQGGNLISCKSIQYKSLFTTFSVISYMSSTIRREVFDFYSLLLCSINSKVYKHLHDLHYSLFLYSLYYSKEVFMWFSLVILTHFGLSFPIEIEFYWL